jgi:hypothetical protein
MKRGLIIVGGLGVVLAVGVLVMVFFAAEAKRTTDTRSSDFSDDQAKMAFLKKYLKMYSEIEATEFHVRYQDNSGLVPGPSNWDMQVVMKIPRDKLGPWTTGLKKTDQADLSWGYDLLPKDERWAIRSKPTIYCRGQTVVAVFESEGIVFKQAKVE